MKGSLMMHNVSLHRFSRVAALALACGAFTCLGAGTAFATGVAVQTDATTSTVTCEFSNLRENCTITMGKVVAYKTAQDYADKKALKFLLNTSKSSRPSALSSRTFPRGLLTTVLRSTTTMSITTVESLVMTSSRC